MGDSVAKVLLNATWSLFPTAEYNRSYPSITKLCMQAPPPLPSKTSNGSSSSSWGAPSASTSAPLSGGGYGSGSASAGGVKGGNDGDRLAAIEAKLDKIMRHLQIS